MHSLFEARAKMEEQNQNATTSASIGSPSASNLVAPADFKISIPHENYSKFKKATFYMDGQEKRFDEFFSFDDGIYTCNKCGRKYEVINSGKVHYRTKHSDRQPVVQRLYPTNSRVGGRDRKITFLLGGREELLNSCFSVLGGFYECRKCGKSYEELDSAKSHYRRYHPEGPSSPVRRFTPRPTSYRTSDMNQFGNGMTARNPDFSNPIVPTTTAPVTSSTHVGSYTTHDGLMELLCAMRNSDGLKSIGPTSDTPTTSSSSVDNSPGHNLMAALFLATESKTRTANHLNSIDPTLAASDTNHALFDTSAYYNEMMAHLNAMENANQSKTIATTFPQVVNYGNSGVNGAFEKYPGHFDSQNSKALSPKKASGSSKDFGKHTFVNTLSDLGLLDKFDMSRYSVPDSVQLSTSVGSHDDNSTDNSETDFLPNNQMFPSDGSIFPFPDDSSPSGSGSSSMSLATATPQKSPDGQFLSVDVGRKSSLFSNSSTPGSSTSSIMFGNHFSVFNPSSTTPSGSSDKTFDYQQSAFRPVKPKSSSSNSNKQQNISD